MKLSTSAKSKGLTCSKMIQKAYKFRIYPNKTQEVLLNKTFGCVRYAWNNWVENFNKKEKMFNTPKQFKEEFEWIVPGEVSSVE